MENDRPTAIPYATAKRLATSANCRDIPWLYSFLVHCDSEEDARHSIVALRRSCAEKFLASRVHAVDVSPARATGHTGRGRFSERAYE
jgi:hypothetical protein